MLLGPQLIPIEIEKRNNLLRDIFFLKLEYETSKFITSKFYEFARMTSRVFASTMCAIVSGKPNTRKLLTKAKLVNCIISSQPALNYIFSLRQHAILYAWKANSKVRD